MNPSGAMVSSGTEVGAGIAVDVAVGETAAVEVAGGGTAGVAVAMAVGATCGGMGLGVAVASLGVVQAAIRSTSVTNTGTLPVKARVDPLRAGAITPPDLPYIPRRVAAQEVFRCSALELG